MDNSRYRDSVYYKRSFLDSATPNYNKENKNLKDKKRADIGLKIRELYRAGLSRERILLWLAVPMRELWPNQKAGNLMNIINAQCNKVDNEPIKSQKSKQQDDFDER